MTDLDLGEIRSRFEAGCAALTAITFATPELTAAVSDSLRDVPALAAELARAQRLLGADPFPTLDGYEAAMQALADERARVGALETVLGEVLRHFPAALDADLRDTVRSREVPEVTVARWRRIAEGRWHRCLS